MVKKISLKTPTHVTPMKIADIDNRIKDTTTVVLLHASWCHYCLSFQSEWESFKKSTKNINCIDIESEALDKIRSTNATLYKKLIPSDGTVYFPMIFCFIKTNDKIVKKLYEGERTAHSINKFMSDNTQTKMKGGGELKNIDKKVNKIINNFFKL
jgi:hypothetical protein